MNEFNEQQEFPSATAQAEPVEELAPMPLNFSAIDNLPEAVSPNPLQPITGKRKSLEFLYDIPMQLVFEVGRIDITVKELMELNEGAMIDLRQVSVDSIDIRINGKVLGFGEAIGLQQSFGIRFGELDVFSLFDDISHEE